MNLLESLSFDPSILNVHLFDLGDTPVTLVALAIFALILVVTLVVSRLMQRALLTAFRIRGVTDEGTTGVTRTLLHYLVMFVGFGIGLQTIGLNLSSLFAAGAMFAIVLGFAMQNIAQNFVSGIILLMERSIKPGDVLKVEGRLVRVRQMGIRASIARTLDEEEIIVPNAVMVQSTVTNYTLQDSVYRLRATVGVTYDSDMKKVRATLERLATEMPWRLPSREPIVLLTEFADSSVVFEVSIWIDDPWRARRAHSQLNESIWWAFQEAGITIAFPQLDLHLDPPVVEALRGPAAA